MFGVKYLIEKKNAGFGGTDDWIMISSSLKNWQQSRKYRIEGDTVYGVAQGVGFSVAEEDGGKLCIFMLSAPDSGFDAMEDMLMSERSALRDVQVGDVENYLALFYDESNGRMSDSLLDDLLAYVAANARACGFKAPNKCVKCGAPANKRSFHNGMVQPMCADCRDADKPQRAPRRQTEDYGSEPIVPKRSSYDDSYDEYAQVERRQRRMQIDEEMLGERTRVSAVPEYDDRPVQAESTAGMSFLGALLGALGGLVPFFISLALGFPVAALCFVSGICAVWGYISYNGIKNKSTGLGMTIAASELMSIIAVVVAFMFTSAKEMGSFAEASASMWVTPTNSVVVLIVNLVLCVLGVLLGFAVFSTKLSRYISER